MQIPATVRVRTQYTNRPLGNRTPAEFLALSESTAVWSPDLSLDCESCEDLPFEGCKCPNPECPIEAIRATMDN